MVLQTGWGLLLVGLLAACGQVSSLGDSGADAMAGDVDPAGRAVAPPDIWWLDAGAPPIASPTGSPVTSPVASPMLTPCPDGWLEVVAEDGSVSCDPYGGGREVCPDGSAHFMGDAGCTPVGAPCPIGDFPEGLPTGAAVLYVLSSAPPGGDGSQASPFRTLTEALAGASPGTILAVGKGTYDEAVEVGQGITVWGACAAETRLTVSSPGPTDVAIITVLGEDVRLLNLRVGPADLWGVVAYGTHASVSLDGVLIEGVQGFGLVAAGAARVNGLELVISGTRPDGDGLLGRGAHAQSGSVVNLTRALFSQNREVGVLASGAETSVALSDVVIEDTQAQASDRTDGWGLGVQTGATAVLTRALFSRNRDVGVYASGADTSVTLSDVVIEDTQAQASDGSEGWGLYLQEGARTVVTRARISGNRDVGVHATGADTSVTLSDVVIEDTQARVSDGAKGDGLYARDGATAVLTRARLSRNRDVGVFASGAGTSVALSDVVIEDTQAQASDGAEGDGLYAQDGATAVLTRARLSRNRDVGVFASGAGTSVTLSDVVIEDTQARVSDGTAGRGLGVQDGAAAMLTRARLSRNRDVGVFASDRGTSLTLSDLVIEDTQARESDGTGGRGLSVQGGPTVEVRGARIVRNRQLGVFASGAGTSVALADVVVEDTQANESDGTRGWGLGAVNGATATATRALFTESREIGVLANGAGSSLTLSDVVVQDTRAQESGGSGGRGLGVQNGATATLTRARILRNRDIGVFVASAGTSVTLLDVVVEDTRERLSDGRAGGGLHVQVGASAEVSRTRFVQNRDIGVLALGTGASLRLSDIVVAHTDAQACGRTTCSESPYGMGLVGLSEGKLVATRFEVLGSALCGVMVADAGEVDLSLGQVSGSPIGVCLQVDGYVISRLTESVRYVDNGTNLEATSLPVPEPANIGDPIE